MTRGTGPLRCLLIIPYQELLGNYDAWHRCRTAAQIIPYQELLGNYDMRHTVKRDGLIIPYQELLGNYDKLFFRLMA